MDFIITLDEEKKRLVVKSKCVLNIQCINLIRTEIKSHLEEKKGWDVLADHSESTLANLDYPRMKSVADETILQFTPLSVRKFALVVNTNAGEYGMGRMWEILTSNKSSISTRTVKTVEEANQFLDEPE
jgi:hypothetical protein